MKATPTENGRLLLWGLRSLDRELRRYSLLNGEKKKRRLHDREGGGALDEKLDSKKETKIEEWGMDKPKG